MNLEAQWAESDRKRAEHSQQHDKAAFEGGYAARLGIPVDLNPYTDAELRRIGWFSAEAERQRRSPR